jgi:hypothetical protein
VRKYALLYTTGQNGARSLLASVQLTGRDELGSELTMPATPDGKVTALRVHSGGFLGFGGRTVEIPEGKFIQRGDNVQLGLTAEEVSKLPAVKDGG